MVGGEGPAGGFFFLNKGLCLAGEEGSPNKKRLLTLFWKKVGENPPFPI